MTKKMDRMSDDKFNVQYEQWKQEYERRQALSDLPDHEKVLTVHNTIVKAAQETGTSEEDVRIAEIRKFVDNFPEFVVKMTNELERWKNDHATYRNPDNPEEYWHSPEGKGNPPKWIVEKVGEKPKSKKQEDMDKWLKKLEPFRVNKKETKKAA